MQESLGNSITNIVLANEKINKFKNKQELYRWQILQTYEAARSCAKPKNQIHTNKKFPLEEMFSNFSCMFINPNNFFQFEF